MLEVKVDGDLERALALEGEPGGIKMGKFHNTSTWRRLRTRKLAQDPLCQIHLMKNVVRAASEVHHLLKVDDSPEEALNMMYLQSVCAECHDQITGRETQYKRRVT